MMGSLSFSASLQLAGPSNYYYYYYYYCCCCCCSTCDGRPTPKRIDYMTMTILNHLLVGSFGVLVLNHAKAVDLQYGRQRQSYRDLHLVQILTDFLLPLALLCGAGVGWGAGLKNLCAVDVA